MEASFVYTTAIKKIRGMTARKKVIQGSTSAGKTYGIIPVLIDRAIKEPNIKITIVAETLPAVKDGAVDIFKEVMRNTNRWVDDGWNASSLTYTFSSGSRIQFKSFDSSGKAKSSGKRDILFLNEANHISYDIADALMIRSKETYIDYNPDAEFYAHTEILQEPNSEFLLLTYLDNEALPSETLEDLLIKRDKGFYNVNLDPDLIDTDPRSLFYKDNIKNDYWANWCKVYLYGKTGKLEGVIFNNWEYGEFDESLTSYYGLDFGYSDHPDACIRVAIDEKKKIIYVDEMFYSNKQSIDEITEKIKALPRRQVIADSAEDRLISHLRTYSGQSVRAVKKPAGSVLQGIRLMQNYLIVVTKRSLNWVKEARLYKWADGAKVAPMKINDDAMDATRYVVYTYAARQFKKQERYEDSNTRFTRGDFIGSDNTAW